jgi:L-threonylcarbamoyladenylate synthase
MTATIGRNLKIVKQLLDEGHPVAIPTETVYGLAANACNPIAVAKIFEVKNRPTFDPLIVHVANADAMHKYAAVPAAAMALAKRLGPAPITYIVPVNSVIPDLVTSGLTTVGLRIPNHPTTLELLNQLDYPLAAPSANPFGYVSPTTPAHVQKQLGDKIPYILDGGPCEVGLESTIIDFTTQRPRMLRAGGFPLEQLEDMLGTKIDRAPHSSSRPLAPGMLESHYAPTSPVFLKTREELEPMPRRVNAGFLLFQKQLEGQLTTHQMVLSPSGDLNEAARKLFAALRAFDDLSIQEIFAEPVPDVGLGRAINDRLKRAAGR